MDEHARWNHKRGDRYQAMRVRWVGNPDVGYSTEHDLAALTRAAMIEAERDGWGMDVSDDFNVLVWRAGVLVAVLWMGEVVDDDPAVLARLGSLP